MKTKNKLLTAIVLCMLFLVALPGIGIATAQEDKTLDIYGNANLDDTIDVCDITYTARIFFGLEDETALADANNDTYIDTGDMWQEGLIILGRERELTFVDSVDRIVTVNKPVERVVIAYWIDAALTLQTLKAEDVVVGVTDVIVNEPILFPELSELPCIGGLYPGLDYEKILELEPDVVLTGGAAVGMMSYDEIQDTIQSLNPDIVVLRFDHCYPSSYTDEVRKCGYIFDREEEAEELIDFIEGHLSTIEERVSDIPDAERTKVYTEFFMDYYTSGEGTVFNEYIEMAGGKNIFSDISGYIYAAEPEAVIDRNPEVMLFHAGGDIVDIGYQTDDVTALRNKRDDITNRTGFANVPAVDSGRVYTCHSNIILSVFYFVGVSYYAKWFYPDEFSELDPNAIHQEYLTRFLRIDYDLDNHGVFVYHPQQHPDGR
jgi:iron complex transport system substrate-binding protein